MCPVIGAATINAVEHRTPQTWGGLCGKRGVAVGTASPDVGGSCCRPIPLRSPSSSYSPSAKQAWRRSERRSRPCGAAFNLAEREGFEPPLPFRVNTLSRRAPSTTRTPLLSPSTAERPWIGPRKYESKPFPYPPPTSPQLERSKRSLTKASLRPWPSRNMSLVTAASTVMSCAESMPMSTKARLVW